jgi:hypothetical protein
MISLRIPADDPSAPRLLLTARDAARALEPTLWGLTASRGPIRIGARSVRYSVDELRECPKRMLCRRTRSPIAEIEEAAQ